MDSIELVVGIAKPIVETASKLIEKLAGKPCEIAGDMLADQLSLWQWQQRIRIFHRAEQVMEKEGIAARAIPAGFLVPLLGAAGNVEDDDLQGFWSNLVASAAESDDACQASFVETLKGMSPQEARLLSMVASEKITAVSTRQKAAGQATYFALDKSKLDSLGFLNSDHFWSAATRLQSIGILVLGPIGERSVREKREGKQGQVVTVEVAVETKVQISFSRYGAALFAKVSRAPIIEVSVSDPWASASFAREAALEAGRLASTAITADAVEDRIDKNFNERITVIDS